MIQLGGSFTGTEDLDYVLQFDLGGDVSVATYKWSDDGGVIFDASGVVITLTPVAINNGITVLGVVGTGTDFVLDDLNRFKAFLPYGKSKLLDRDPDTEHRTASATAQLAHVFDLGEPKIPQALVVHYHNFSQKAVMRLQGNATNVWTAPSVNETISWRAGSIVHYIATERARYRYWRLFVDNIGNSDGYYRISGLFLGQFSELQRSFDLGDTRRYMRRGRREVMQQGRVSGGILAEVSELDLSWTGLSKTDRDVLIAAFRSTNDVATHSVRPIFVDPASALGEVLLCEWSDMVEVRSSDMPGRYELPVRLIEIPRTVLSI